MKLRLLVLAVCLLALLPLGARATDALGKSPHGVAAGCESCHTAGTPVGTPKPIVKNCLACHPSEDHHPIGMQPKEIKVAVGWPLEDGKVTCATCHAEPGCSADRAREAPYLRGGNPAGGIKEFCYRCHESTSASSRSSPHPKEGRPAADGSCSVCHAGVPKPNVAPAEAHLRLEPTKVCLTCHPGEVHTGLSAHLGKTLPRPIDPAVAIEFPLAPGGVIACWTCHDVHNSASTAPPARRRLGDALAAAVRGTTPEPLHTTALLALPADDGSLCRACHGNGP